MNIMKQNDFMSEIVISAYPDKGEFGVTDICLLSDVP